MSAQYKKGVIDFCEYAAKNAKDSRFILCPCRNCLNVITVEGIDILKEHLLCDEIDKTYTCWTYHGEKKGERSSTNINSHYQFEDIMDTNIFGGAEGSTSGDKNDIPTMFNKELQMLTAVSELLPDGNVLPRRTYEAKQMLKSIGLVHDRIHVFPNDCILYRKEYAELDECPKYSLKCYKNDSPQWKIFDDTHKDFGKEPRNLHLALLTDGINPHRLQSSSHSTWPVGNDIDVYLAPLIEDLKLLWEEGIESVKGYYACPLCGKETDHIRLKHCKKCVYMGHRRWLAPNHRYRNMPLAFNEEVEERHAPPLLSGDDIFKKIENLNIQFGKKNVFDSLIGTLLGVPGKTKDGLNARMDMMEMGTRNELGPVEKPGKKPYLPPASHTLSKDEKRVLLQTLHSVTVPEGYSSNIKNLVSMSDMKLKGLKSHDCHVIVENLLPIAIRSIFPEKVRITITKLCWFFKSISSKVIDPRRLLYLQRQIIETLCEVEMYFPTSFFDIMIHLTVHLIYETRMCGPAQFIPNVDVIGLPSDRHSGRTDGEGVTGGQQVEINRAQWYKVHLCVLHNTVDVVPFVDLHKQTIIAEHPGRGANWIELEHNRTFID
ncbi:uncharacterized protein LOC141692994 [Apium graveolens]|uniref:uncharacterized protein LOC141692994 n=1 Tax=Apium graveolens TaxID=4045 RepID=UPI003D7B9437